MGQVRGNKLWHQASLYEAQDEQTRSKGWDGEGGGGHWKGIAGPGKSCAKARGQEGARNGGSG